MKKICAPYKDSARGALIGHYGLIIGATILVELITLLIDLPFIRMLREGMTYQILSRIVFGYLGTAVVYLICIVLNAGLCRIHLEIARNQPVRFSSILYAFQNRPNRYLGYGLLMYAITFLCGLPAQLVMAVSLSQAKRDAAAALPLMWAGMALFAAGMIILLILSLQLSQTLFLLIEFPDESMFSAVRQSTRLMRKNKWLLFKLYLSFIGWFFLGILTLGTGFFWILPYLNQSVTQFYLGFYPNPRPEA